MVKGFIFFETLDDDDEAAASVPKSDRYESPPPPKKKQEKRKEKEKEKRKNGLGQMGYFYLNFGPKQTFYFVICLKEYFVFWLDDNKPEIEKCDMHELFQKKFN